MRNDTIILAALLALAVTPTALAGYEREESLRFAAGTAVVTNLAGQVRLAPSVDDEYRVVARIVAEDAAVGEKVELRQDGSGRTMRVTVVFPVREYDTYLYEPDTRSRGRTRVEYLGRRVTVTGRASGDAVALHVDLEIQVPAGATLRLDNEVGAIEGQDLRAELELESSAGSIGISDSKGEARLDTGSGAIRVTGHSGQVVADTGSGPVTLENVLGDVGVDTGSGGVRLVGVSGDVSVDTGSGGVELEDILAGRISVDTGSGGVRARRIRGSFLADTGSGGVRLEDFQAGEALRVDTGSGRIELGGDMSGIREMELDSGSGGVEIRTSALPSMRLRVSAGSGRIDVQIPDLHDVVSREGYLEGVIGDGAGRGRIETGSGGVRIRML